jgi:hypothetical protein
VDIVLKRRWSPFFPAKIDAWEGRWNCMYFNDFKNMLNCSLLYCRLSKVGQMFEWFVGIEPKRWRETIKCQFEAIISYEKRDDKFNIFSKELLFWFK